MKHQDMMDSLLSLGMQRGMVTCQELNDAFPAEFLPLEEVELFLRLLEGLGVKVIDSLGSRKKKARRNRSQSNKAVKHKS